MSNDQEIEANAPKSKKKKNGSKDKSKKKDKAKKSKEDIVMVEFLLESHLYDDFWLLDN